MVHECHLTEVGVLRYKIRMMGIPLSGPTYVYGDNKSQVTNSSRPESTFKKSAIPFATMQSVNQMQWVRPCLRTLRLERI
jgi:hypothetical protein